MLHHALCLDFETNGVDPSTHRVIEVGMVLYSLTAHSIVRCMSTLVDAGTGNAAEAVNGIPPALLVEDGISEAKAFSHVEAWMRSADIVLAHSAEFDRSFLPPELRERLPFVCTMNDLAWPRASAGKSLTSIALAHGLGVSHAHRALTDAMTIARLLERVHEMGVHVQAMLAKGMRPRGTYQALVSFDDKQLAKDAGFTFEGATKAWTRRICPEDLPELALPFKVREVAA